MSCISKLNSDLHIIFKWVSAKGLSLNRLADIFIQTVKNVKNQKIPEKKLSKEFLKIVYVLLSYQYTAYYTYFTLPYHIRHITLNVQTIQTTYSNNSLCRFSGYNPKYQTKYNISIQSIYVHCFENIFYFSLRTAPV